MWWLSLLSRWVATCTAPMLRSGLSLQNLPHHLQQVGGLGEEEELLLPEEGRARRGEDRRGEEEKATLLPAVVFSLHVASYRFCTLRKINHSTSGFHSINTYLVYIRGVTGKRFYAFQRRHLHYFVLFWCLASSARKPEPTRRNQDCPKNF